MKLTIEIEGEEKDLMQIAEQLSDGGGEQSLTPGEFDDSGKFILFDYSRCFPAWGYNKKKHGPDRLVTAKVTTE